MVHGDFRDKYPSQEKHCQFLALTNLDQETTHEPELSCRQRLG